MGFEVKGIDELIRALQDIASPEFADSVLRQGLTEVGRLIQASAKRNAHVDEGQLRNSIEVTPLENGVEIGSNVPQAFFEEYGIGRKGDPSVAHTAKEQWSYQDDDGNWHTTSGHEPHPFLYPALEEHKQEIPETVKNVLQAKIKERMG